MIYVRTLDDILVFSKLYSLIRGLLDILKIHIKYIKYFKDRLGISEYALLWISFFKGLIIGLLLYHIFIR